MTDSSLPFSANYLTEVAVRYLLLCAAIAFSLCSGPVMAQSSMTLIGPTATLTPSPTPPTPSCTSTCISGQNDMGLKWDNTVKCEFSKQGIKLSCKNSAYVLMGMQEGFAYCVDPKVPSPCTCAGTKNCVCIPTTPTYPCP